MKLKRCGTSAAYHRHRDHGEDACDACKRANTNTTRRYRRRRRPKVEDRLKDLLFITGGDPYRYSAAALAHRFGVSTRTIVRWRRRLTAPAPLAAQLEWDGQPSYEVRREALEEFA